jgi:hydrogenase nickel incorporation protein HypB
VSLERVVLRLLCRGVVQLAEVVGFDRAAARAAVARVAPHARLLEVSARSGDGMEALLELLL